MDKKNQNILKKQLKILEDHKQEWRDLSYTEKLGFLKGMMERVFEHQDLWASTGTEAKKVDGILEELSAGPLVTSFVLRNFISQYEKASEHERKGEDVTFRTPTKIKMINGQHRIQVYPNSIQEALMQPVVAETWVRPGFEATWGQAVIDSKLLPPKVALVLGAGNNSSIVVLDTLHKLFNDNEVVILKHNPVCEWMFPIFDLIFAELIERGFVQHTQGGVPEGQFLVDNCDTIHITGSHITHDMIVWGKESTREVPLKVNVTSELGCITPIMICPINYSDDELNNMAEKLVRAMANNVGYNCNSPKVFLVASGWEQREKFWDLVKEKFGTTPVRHPYYPGSFERYNGYTERYPFETVGECGDDKIPWTIFRDVDPDVDDHVLINEPFCPIVSEIVIVANSVPQFLRKAVTFSNGRLWGNLSCSIFIGDEGRKSYCIELDRAISDLNYGGVAINQWSSILFFLGPTAWGGYHTNTLENIQSGIGFVRNGMFIDNIEKCVVTGKIEPERDSNVMPLLRSVIAYEANPSLINFGGVVLNGLKAMLT